MSARRLPWRGLVAGALLATLAGAAALVFDPTLLAPVEDALGPAHEWIERIETDQLLLLSVALIGALAALVAAIRTLSGSDPAPELVDGDERPPEATSVDPATVSGYTADRTIENVASLDDAREIRDDLRAVAVDALRVAGESPEDARRRIEHGEWTDDAIAAGFLGEAVPMPLLARLRGWLDGGAEGRRRLRRSIDAVATLAAAPDRAVRADTEGDDE